MKRVALYCRVSTDQQEKEETIENQIRELKKIYENDEIVKIYTDTASGSDLDRKELNELRTDAQKKLFDTIGVWDTSRLARDTKLTLILLEEFKQNGIKIEVMGKPLEDSPEGKFLVTMLAALDEMEKEKIKRRFMAGKKRLLAEGKLIGCYPPYGYKYVRDKQKGIEPHFEINEEEARIVRKVFQLYLELQSIFLVAKKLAELGIKNRGKGLDKPKFFHASMVKKILRNEVYIGNFYYGKVRKRG
ncbi:MAG: recombinase family protein [candidate division WOR-3 bacterium]